MKIGTTEIVIGSILLLILLNKRNTPVPPGYTQTPTKPPNVGPNGRFQEIEKGPSLGQYQSMLDPKCYHAEV